MVEISNRNQCPGNHGLSCWSGNDAHGFVIFIFVIHVYFITFYTTLNIYFKMIWFIFTYVSNFMLSMLLFFFYLDFSFFRYFCQEEAFQFLQ